MTSDTGAVARIVDGLREIAAGLERDLREAPPEHRSNAVGAVLAARECLAVAEAQR